MIQSLVHIVDNKLIILATNSSNEEGTSGLPANVTQSLFGKFAAVRYNANRKPSKLFFRRLQ